MKKRLNSILLILLTLALVLSASACGSTEETKGTESSAEASQIEKTCVWENATYVSDKEFGEGAKKLVVEVKAGEQQITFTVNTDKATVGEALLEHKLIDGEDGQYGLYVKVVNGITADYDIDQSYWAFHINGEYAMTGVDATEITEGAVYKLEYTK